MMNPHTDEYTFGVISGILDAERLIRNVLDNVRDNPQIPEFYALNICSSLEKALDRLMAGMEGK